MQSNRLINADAAPAPGRCPARVTVFNWEGLKPSLTVKKEDEKGRTNLSPSHQDTMGMNTMGMNMVGFGSRPRSSTAQIVPTSRCGYIKIRVLFTYEVPLCVALKSMANLGASYPCFALRKV